VAWTVGAGQALSEDAKRWCVRDWGIIEPSEGAIVALVRVKECNKVKEGAGIPSITVLKRATIRMC